MTLGNLISATAYEISPRQVDAFQGGFVENLADLGQALADKSLIDSLRNGTPVTFEFGDETSRIHDVRDALMSFCFKENRLRLDASLELCKRLAGKMDGRNKNCLLLISVHDTQDIAAREVIVWMFPYDRVIQRSGGRVALEDAFSLTSGLRKAASFKGSNTRTGFLSGIALDHQSSTADQKVANFWIMGFLGGALQITSSAGTTLVAGAFRVANKALQNDESAQSQLFAAINLLRIRTDRNWTMQGIANDLLPVGTAREAFEKAAGTGPETRSPFRLDLDQFDSKTKYRVFKLDNGVTVASPFVEVGRGVTIEESEGGAILKVSGRIAGEVIRSTV